MAYQYLQQNKLAFSFALIWGLGMLLVGWLFKYGILFAYAIESIYLAFKPTFVGAVWGFVDSFIFIWPYVSI